MEAGCPANHNCVASLLHGPTAAGQPADGSDSEKSGMEYESAGKVGGDKLKKVGENWFARLRTYDLQLVKLVNIIAHFKLVDITRSYDRMNG